MPKPAAMTFPPCRRRIVRADFVRLQSKRREILTTLRLSKLPRKPFLPGISNNRAGRESKRGASGIIIKIPKSPPRTATSITREISRSKPKIKIAGIVTPNPNAIDSPARTSRLHDVVFENRRVAHIRFSREDETSVIEITATGIEAETVKPTFKTR